MMDWTLWIQFTISALVGMVGLGGIIVAIGYVWGTFKKGRNEGELSTIDLFEKRVAALEQKIKDLEITIKERDKTIAERETQLRLLYTENQAKNKKIEEYLEIFKGRDPQMQAFIEIMKKYVEANLPLLQKISTEVIPTIEKLDKFLNKQTF